MSKKRASVGDYNEDYDEDYVDKGDDDETYTKRSKKSKKVSKTVKRGDQRATGSSGLVEATPVIDYGQLYSLKSDHTSRPIWIIGGVNSSDNRIFLEAFHPLYQASSIIIHWSIIIRCLPDLGSI